METALFAGYPKSGNTLIGQTLNLAGEIETPFDIYDIRRSQITPTPNPLFETTTYCIKTHDSYTPFRNIDNLYFGKVSKIVVFNRNPFDTLLSAINYFRVEFKNNGGKFDPSKAHMLSLMALFPDFELKETFLSDFTLEILRDNGMLDIALRNFGAFGTSILCHYSMSGTWSDFAGSYDDCGVDVLKFSYEKFEKMSLDSIRKDNAMSEELLELSSYLEVSPGRLNQGFAKQRQFATKSESAREVKFISWKRSGYWKEYFSPKACKTFLDRHYSAVVKNGYEYLIDEVNTIK